MYRSQENVILYVHSFFVVVLVFIFLVGGAEVTTLESK